jgi:hypothetical protein
MAYRLADELLQMILAPSLTSSASALLVCKRWLRVATPLLYETLIVRSTGQSQALADVLRQNPAFAGHVKKVRLEGAYVSLDEVLTRCTNLTTLVMLLRVYSDAKVKGLCRSLSVIDPKDVILRDEWQIDNVKIREVFIALCEAILKWKNMVCLSQRRFPYFHYLQQTTFEFPYHAYGYGNTMIGPGINRRTRLIEALTHSTSLRLICCEMPEIQIDHWKPLALIPFITLRFRYRSMPGLWQMKIRQRILDEISKDKQLSKASIEFIDLSE